MVEDQARQNYQSELPGQMESPAQLCKWAEPLAGILAKASLPAVMWFAKILLVCKPWHLSSCLIPSDPAPMIPSMIPVKGDPSELLGKCPVMLGMLPTHLGLFFSPHWRTCMLSRNSWSRESSRQGAMTVWGKGDVFKGKTAPLTFLMGPLLSLWSKGVLQYSITSGLWNFHNSVLSMNSCYSVFLWEGLILETTYPFILLMSLKITSLM